MLAYDTAGNVINKAMAALGLLRPADPYTSTDPLVVQLVQLLSDLGQDLCNKHPWSVLQRQVLVTTVLSQATYALPSDFLRWQDATAWNRTGRLPLGPGLNGAEWQYLNAIGVSPALTVVWRQWQGTLAVFPAPPAGIVLAWEYVSGAWVQPVGQAAPTLNAPTAATDTLWFDAAMLRDGLRYAFRAAKGFDAQDALDRWTASLEAAKANDTPGRSLLLSSSGAGPRLIDERNLPITGYGG